MSDVSVSDLSSEWVSSYQNDIVTNPFVQDVKAALLNWRIWLLLSWQDIRLRYRRSQLGPFWLTISMALTIYVMGFLYSHLLNLTIRNYFPYLAAGLLVWHFVAMVLADGINIFVLAEHFLKQVKLPYSVYILRAIMRSFIIFLHNVIVMIPLYYFFDIHLSIAFLMIIPGTILLILNAFFYGMVMAIIGARYRDLGQLITSVIQIIFFVTPIMWNPATLPEKYLIWVKINPFAQLIEIMRAPLMSTFPSSYSLNYVLIFTVVGAVLATWLFNRARPHIIFWI